MYKNEYKNCLNVSLILSGDRSITFKLTRFFKTKFTTKGLHITALTCCFQVCLLLLMWVINKYQHQAHILVGKKKKMQKKTLQACFPGLCLFVIVFLTMCTEFMLVELFPSPLILNISGIRKCRP